MGRAPARSGRRPVHRLVARVLAATLVVALAAACSSDGDDEQGDGGADGGDTTTSTVDAAASGVGAAMADQLDGLVDVTAGQEQCLGASISEALGEGALAAVQVADATWTPDQQEALTEAMNTCIDGESFAPQVTEGFYEGLGGLRPTDEVVDCAADQFEGSTGVVTFEALAARTTGALPDSLYRAFDACIPNDDVIALMTGAFTESGLTPAQAECVANELVGKVTLADFAQISADSGSIPAEVQAAINGASAACVGAT